ncbi:MAG: hypothetical protein ACI8ZN_002040 [Bacteroidia bacterium]|jgi:uncharacterized protein (TIGR01777 family)
MQTQNHKTILVTGGTGLVGRSLCALLTQHGHSVRILTRQPTDVSIGRFTYDLTSNTIDEKALVDVDVVVHLAGENVAGGRWTSHRKQQIRSSRVDTAKLILLALQKNNQVLTTFITASGIGYYGSNPTGELREDSKSGSDFLAKICIDWEAAAEEFKSVQSNVFVNRIGIVLAKGGGFVQKLMPLINLHLGSVLGSGNQDVAWIHIHDLCEIIAKQIEGELLAGIYNVCAPETPTHHQMIESMAKQSNKRLWLPNVPEFALKLALGEMSEAVLSSQKAIPQKLVNQNFSWKYPNHREAYKNCLTE